MKFEVWILMFLFMVGAVNAATLFRGVSSAIQYENHPKFEEIYRIKIENKADGTIEVSEDEYGGWKPVGRVLYPTQKVNEGGYAAAKWVSEGRVAASAVNAIHIKTGPPEWSRTIFSVLPQEFLPARRSFNEGGKPPKEYRSYLSPDASICTDIPAGEKIFGGGYAPFVGNVVMLSQPAKPVVPLPRGYVPQIGDIYYIIVDRPADYPKEIIFENRFGGRITISYYSGTERVIGEVLRPVVGIGRFEGSKYAGAGRIRANHAGVIDVSVSPVGGIGGFQIVPALHGEDMGYVKETTQWMVIGPAQANDPSLEGMAPFFKYFIHPSFGKWELESEKWEEELLARFLVEVKYAGEDNWRPMPVIEIDDFYMRRYLPSFANSVLKIITHFRILFPVD